jgi:hypothetical protein
MRSRLAFIFFYVSYSIASFGNATRRNIRWVRYGVVCLAAMRLVIRLITGR